MNKIDLIKTSSNKIKNDLNKKERNKKHKDIQVLNPLHKNIKKYDYDMEKINNIGNIIYNKNDFLAKIYDIMSYNTFNNYFKEYINDYSDVQVSILYFYLYNIIDEQFKTYFKREIKKGEMIYLLKEIMSNSDMRKYFINFTNDNKLIQLNNYKTENKIIDGINNILNINKIKFINN